MNPQRLFVASCIALLATAMSFAIRGDIMGELELAFGLDKIQLGWISGAAFLMNEVWLYASSSVR
mgnify:CR=1 FL=1